jgi:hypothetical protein
MSKNDFVYELLKDILQGINEINKKLEVDE